MSPPGVEPGPRSSQNRVRLRHTPGTTVNVSAWTRTRIGTFGGSYVDPLHHRDARADGGVRTRMIRVTRAAPCWGRATSALQSQARGSHPAGCGYEPRPDTGPPAKVPGAGIEPARACFRD